MMVNGERVIAREIQTLKKIIIPRDIIKEKGMDEKITHSNGCYFLF